MRKEHRITQGAMAFELNISRSHYAALEGGRSMFNLDQLVGIAKFYDVTLSFFLDEVL